jgi:hypothetical protein
MFPYNFNLVMAVTLIIGPAVQLQPAHNTNTTALTKMFLTGFGYLGPDFHIKVGHFALANTLRFVKSVAGYRELADPSPLGGAVGLRIADQMIYLIVLY